MREIPECLNRRNKVLNELIQEIRTALPLHTGGKVPELSYLDIGPEAPDSPPPGPPPHPIRDKASATTASVTTTESTPKNDVGTKLMCDFWRILEDDPECDLREEVQHRMCKDNCKAKCKKPAKRPAFEPPECCKPSFSAKEDDSLRKALGDVRTAASYEQKCHEKVGELQIIQKDLVRQINSLEEKSKKETGLLKEADCMWSCMEGSYKNRLADAKENCELLQSQLNEIETSLNKWKKTQDDVETELKCVNKNCQDTNIKIIQKENDIKIMQIEIEGFKKRIDTNEKDLIAARNSYETKKEASDIRVVKIIKEIEAFQKQNQDDCKRNEEKERQGEASIKEVREDLQKLCRCLLQKKIANEDLRAETEALVNEVELLKKACITCRNRCNRREKNIIDECKRMDKEISKFTLRCIRCHKETSSADVTGFCFECPRCLNERECLNEGDHCETDHAQDCICTRIKHKFLDNVFDNMYTVLESQVCTCPGKEIADCILTCLKRSRNGKLNDETRLIVQDFILSTVRQNLNLTIVGGAVKTRCEMDEETYQQLMLCLKDVIVTQPEKTEKGTVVKKLPCTRWSHSVECHCPSGPKTCPCLKTAARKSTSPSTCGPEFSRHAEDEGRREDPSVRFCPLPDPATCGLDCSLLDPASGKSWKRPPCTGGTCNFSSNMRAAQCVLGPEALADVRSHPSKVPPVPFKAPADPNEKTDGRISNPTVRISTSNVRIIPSEHTYPPDKRKYSGDLSAYQGDEPSNSNDKAVYFVSIPAYSTNKLTYSPKKPAYYASKPAYPVDEKTYLTDKFMFAVDEPAYSVVEPAYLADEPAYAVEERVHRPGGRAYSADVYPVDKPVHPTEERVHRPGGRAHPADESVYPANEPAYPVEERIYRPDGRVYRRYEPVYPADETAYPAEERVYRPDGRAYPAYEPVYPVVEPTYQAEELVYRPDRRVYSAYDPVYPAEERVYRPDGRAYPAYEPVYPAYEPIYPANVPAYQAEERAYMPDESKQKADKHSQKLDGRSLDKSMPESSAYATDERVQKDDRHPQKPDRHPEKPDGRAYPAEEHAYKPNGRTQKADRCTLDEPESRAYTTDERAEKVDRHPQKPDGSAYPADEHV